MSNINNQILNNVIPTYLITDLDSGVCKIESQGSKFYLNADCDNMFNGCTALVMNLDTVFENVKWDYVENMASAFNKCSNLTGSPICGNNVKNMFGAYVLCSNLTGSPICGDNVQDMSGAYISCNNLTGKAVFGNNVKIATQAYQGCSNITEMEPWPDSIQPGGMGGAFMGCSNLKVAYIGGKNANNGPSAYAGAFYSCPNIRDIIISPYMTSIYSLMAAAFSNAAQIINIPDIPDNVVNMDSAFAGCSNLMGPLKCGNGVTEMNGTYASSTISQSPVCGPNVINMQSAYGGCSKLSGTAVLGPNVVNAVSAYGGCSSLEASCPWPDTIQNFSGIYGGCTNLKIAYIGGKNFTNATDFQSAYGGCPITDIILSPYLINISSTAQAIGFSRTLVNIPNIPDNVINMSFAFQGCGNALGNPEVGKNVTDMTGAYQGCYNLTGSPVCGPNVINCQNAYSYCSNLTGNPVIGINVKNCQYMYQGCGSLTGTLDIVEHTANGSLWTCHNIFQGRPTSNLINVKLTRGSYLAEGLLNQTQSLVGYSMTWEEQEDGSYLNRGFNLRLILEGDSPVPPTPVVVDAYLDAFNVLSDWGRFSTERFIIEREDS